MEMEGHVMVDHEGGAELRACSVEVLENMLVEECSLFGGHMLTSGIVDGNDQVKEVFQDQVVSLGGGRYQWTP